MYLGLEVAHGLDRLLQRPVGEAVLLQELQQALGDTATTNNNNDNNDNTHSIIMKSIHTLVKVIISSFPGKLRKNKGKIPERYRER